MASCLGCGNDMVETSRKIMKDKSSSKNPTYKVIYQCKNASCGKKGVKISFLDDGLMQIPLSDGQ
jgi:hypothetical protein